MTLGGRFDPRRSERGVATVEAVLVVPLVLIPVLFAVIVFGELWHTRLVVDAAAAAGARQAAVVGARLGLGSTPTAAMLSARLRESAGAPSSPGLTGGRTR